MLSRPPSSRTPLRFSKSHPYIHQTYHFRGLIYSEYGLHTVALGEFHKVMMVKPTIGSEYFFRYILPFLEKNWKLIPTHSDSIMLYVTSPAARALSNCFLAYFQDDYAIALMLFTEVVAAEMAILTFCRRGHFQ